MNRRSVSDLASDRALASAHLKRLLMLPLFLLAFSLSSSSTSSASSVIASTPGATGELKRTSTGTPSLSSRAASAISSASIQRTGAVVRVRGTDARGELNGTGFFVDPTGTICTVADLVKGSDSIVIVKGGKAYPCKILALDEGSGTAFLKLIGEMPHSGENFLSPRALPTPYPFTPAIAIGYPREEDPSISVGMITGTKSHEGDYFFRVPQHMAKILLTEGEAGSPVFDLDGHLIGMVLAGNSQAGDCRILPSGAIEKLHMDLLRFGQLHQGWVGAVVEEAAVPEGSSSTRIAAVEPGSPAEAAGLQSGDMILALGTRRITQPDTLLEASFYLTAGESVPMTIWRGGKISHVAIHCVTPPEAKNYSTAP
ncbi:MAG: S1C family serine protease [Verrucomicrobia bacterium]|nr:S1C family serine protease [Verrucomicrobiota bacterium]